jgi:hypothetical protein
MTIRYFGFGGLDVDFRVELNLPNTLTTRHNVGVEVFSAVTVKNVVFWDIKHSSYFTGNTLRLRYRVQPVNAM